jgi:phosphotransferase system HPr (HPr) family protein
LLEFDVKIRSRRGLHVRPAAQVVAMTSEFDSEVRLKYQDRSVDGKSILGLLVLAAPHGARLRVQLDGPDEETAGNQLRALFDSFPEKTPAKSLAE